MACVPCRIGLATISILYSSLPAFRSRQAGPLHQRHIVMRVLVEPLRPVQPIVSAFEFGAQQARVVPAVDWKARQIKVIITFGRAANDGGHAVFETLVLQNAHEELCKDLILFGERKWVREGLYCRANFLF